MKAGKLDRRVTIMRGGAPVDDGYTSQPGALTTYAVRWAAWEPARGREVSENMGREAYSSGTFHVRYDKLTSAIKETDTVMYSGRAWNITSVTEMGRGEGIQLTVVSGDNQP